MFPPLRIALPSLPACLCLAFLTPASFAQFSNQSIPYATQELVQRQISWDENRPSEKNPAGLYFQFSKIDEKISSGKRVAQYRAYVFGVPESKKYTLTVWKVGSEPHLLSSGIYVNAKGLLMVHKPHPEQLNSDFVGGDEFHLDVQAAQAEPVRYSLTSTDKEILVYGTVVPFPREDTDRGCQLEVRLALSDASAVLIYADGLPANTVVPFQLLSVGDPETRKFNVNTQGHAVSTVFPSSYGKESSSLKVTLTTAECSVAVDLP